MPWPRRQPKPRHGTSASARDSASNAFRPSTPRWTLLEEAPVPLTPVPGVARKRRAKRLVLNRFPYAVIVREQASDTGSCAGGWRGPGRRRGDVVAPAGSRRRTARRPAGRLFCAVGVAGCSAGAQWTGTAWSGHLAETVGRLLTCRKVDGAEGLPDGIVGDTLDSGRLA